MTKPARATSQRPHRQPLRKTRLALAISTLLAPGLLITGQALAAPTGGHVTSGHATIAQQGAVTNIHQSSHKASINWQAFSTAPTETVNFHQPNAASVTLNRVIGNEASVLQGALNADGQVFLLNSNGVLIGKGASINTAGFVASTLGLSDADFQNGHYRFDANGHHSGSLVNLGTITVANKGYAALLGQTVKNEGVIVARQGTVSLASGNRITLNFNGDSLLNVTLDQGALNALVENKHAIIADGGQILLTAKAATALLESQVNNTGILQAQTLDDISGKIELYAHGGTTTVNGTLDASAPAKGNRSGNGGFIETSGDVVKIADTANITTLSQNGQTGTWLIDPVDFTIAATGGDITGTALSNRLASNHVTIQSVSGSKQGKGDIIVNDRVSWNANTTLALEAENDIHINNAITIGGEKGQLVMTTGKDGNGGDYHIRTKASYSGAVLDANGRPVAKQDTSGGVYGSVTFTNTDNKDGLVINGTQYALLHNMTELADISGIKGHYALANNLEGGYHTKAVVDVLEEGVLTGLGHVVRDLTINAPDVASGTGLIGSVNANTTLRDVGVVNVDIKALGHVGALLGGKAASVGNVTISNAYSTGSIYSRSIRAGGLVGSLRWNFDGIGNLLTDVFSTVEINSNSYEAGGLVGSLLRGSLIHAHATGNISLIPRSANTTISKGGGLVGGSELSNIGYAYATGNVTSNDKSSKIGGLIGFMSLSLGSEINFFRNAYASGNIIGGTDVGGMVGELATNGIFRQAESIASIDVNNIHATGNITSFNSSAAGGLIGYASGAAMNNNTKFLFLNIQNASASGNVTGLAIVGNNLGGLIGGLGHASISDAHASGNITVGGVNKYGVGVNSIGGLVGSTGRYSTIVNSSASGNVTGSGSMAGGLVGQNRGTIRGSYATGTVSGSSMVGGLVGRNNMPGMRDSEAIIENSYWNSDTNATGVGRNVLNVNIANTHGLTVEQMADVAYYLDGTIDQVLASRAEMAATLRKRLVAANQQTGNAASIGHQHSASRSAFSSTHLSRKSHLPALENQISLVRANAFTANVQHLETEETVYMVSPVE